MSLLIKSEYTLTRWASTPLYPFSFDQPTPSKLSSSPFPFSLLGAETAKSTTLPLLDTQQADEEAEEQESNCPTPSTTAAVPTPESGSISPVDSLAASHLRPLPVAADTTEFFGNAETNTVPVSQLNGAVAKSRLGFPSFISVLSLHF